MESIDFLNAFLELPETVSDPEYDKAITEYRECFGHIPPTAMIPDGFDRKLVIEALHKCVSSGNSNVLELLNISVNENFYY